MHKFSCLTKVYLCANIETFEFLTLAIKISFLFDFCTDVFLNVTVEFYFVKFCRLDHFFPLMLQLLTDNF